MTLDRRTILAGAAANLLAAPAIYAAAAPRLRVMTYNIHHGEGTDGKLDLKRIAEAVRSADADLAALQEVDRKTTRSDRLDEPAVLGELLTMQAIFGKNINVLGGEYGNAILSRWPVIIHRNHLLPSLNHGEQRSVLEVQIKLPWHNQPVPFLGTHFDHRGPSDERLASAQRLNELAESLGLSTVLAGDLNTTPKSSVMERLAAKWQLANATDLPTFPASKPDRQIDFVLTRLGGLWKPIQTTVLNEPIASDHRPLLAVLEWRSGE